MKTKDNNNEEEQQIEPMGDFDDDDQLLMLPSLAKKKKGTILMLHGWAQNAKVMKFKTKNLTKRLTKVGYECVFLEAPHVLPMKGFVKAEATSGNNNNDDMTMVEIEYGKRPNARAWFVYSQTNPCDSSMAQDREGREYIGLEKSLSIVTRALQKFYNVNKDDNIIGIYGFSQGGVFAHILSQLATGFCKTNENLPVDKHKKDDDNALVSTNVMDGHKHASTLFQKINFAILVGAFPSRHDFTRQSTHSLENKNNDNLSERQQQSLNLPSLHFISENDIKVRPELSLELQQSYKNSQVIFHEKGHIIPQRSSECSAIISFLEKIKSDA